MNDYTGRYGRSNRWLGLMRELADCMSDLRDGEEDEGQVRRAMAELEPHIRQMPQPHADLAESLLRLARSVLGEYEW